MAETVREHFEQLICELEQQRKEVAEKMERIDHALAQVAEALKMAKSREDKMRSFLDEVMTDAERAEACIPIPEGTTRYQALLMVAEAKGFV